MKDLKDYLKEIEKMRPVVQCITNIVTVNDCANALLAIGASPTMAHHPEEMEDFSRFCDALVCNMGATESLEAMEIAGRLAAGLGHPIVIDPVGCAGSTFRREKCLRLIRSVHPSCIRGNALEIRALARNTNTGKGVDAAIHETADSEAAAHEAADRETAERETAAHEAADRETAERETAAHEAADRETAERETAAHEAADRETVDRETAAHEAADNHTADKEKELEEIRNDVLNLSVQTGAIVAATGETDVIGYKGQILELHGGSAMMAKMTGSGCMLSAILGAFLAVENSLSGAAAACSYMNQCAETAQKWTNAARRGTGTFHTALLDALSTGMEQKHFLSSQ